MPYVYLIKAVGFDRIKMGYWSGKKDKLRNRYITPYGSDLQIFTYETTEPTLLEWYFKIEFENDCICCELYRCDKLDAYKEFLETNKDLPKDQLEHIVSTFRRMNDPNTGRCVIFIHPEDFDDHNLLYIY
jgi:hypothetical protein